MIKPLRTVRRRTQKVIALAAAAAMILTGCAALPSTGPVTKGDGAISEPGPVFPQGYLPQPDADPEQIVRGFLGASAAGLPDNFAVAREYLTTQMRAQWVPQAEVVAFSREGALALEQDEDASESDATRTTSGLAAGSTSRVELTVHVEARLDEAGRYTQAGSGEEQVFAFDLVRDGANQWRISQLSDGILLSQPNFESVYRMTPLYFLSPDGSHLVPEQRWFPQHNAATHAVRELLSGPSTWLRDGVISAFPAGTTLLRDSVLVDSSGTAQVDLSEAALVADSHQRRLVVEQLESTLSRVSGVRSVNVHVNGLPMDVEGEVEPIRDPVAEGGLTAIRHGEVYAFDFNSGLLIRRLDLVGLGELDITALATGPNANLVAVRVGRSEIMVVPPVPEDTDFSNPDDEDPALTNNEPSAAPAPSDEDAESAGEGQEPEGEANPADPGASSGATTDWETGTDAEAGAEAGVETDRETGAETEGGGETEEPAFEPLFDFAEPYPLLTGQQLLRPTIDRFSWIWTGEQDNPGHLRAAQALKVTDSEINEVEIAAEWLNQREVLDIKVSRDGTRVAVLSHLEGELMLEVSVVVRTGNGTPVRLAEPVRVGAQLSDAVSVIWLDELTLGALGATKQGDVVSSPTITVVPLAGGLRKIATNFEGANWFTTARGEERMVIGVPDPLRNEEDSQDSSSIYSRSGSGWNLISSRAVHFPTYPG